MRTIGSQVDAGETGGLSYVLFRLYSGVAKHDVTDRVLRDAVRVADAVPLVTGLPRI